jgi:hypothetical protein
MVEVRVTSVGSTEKIPFKLFQMPCCNQRLCCSIYCFEAYMRSEVSGRTSAADFAIKVICYGYGLSRPL